MKNFRLILIYIICTSVLFLSLKTQEKVEIEYSISGKFKYSISKEKLLKVNDISEVIPYYPSNWIKDYVAVEVTSKLNGEELKGTGPNNKLSDGHKAVFQKLEVSSKLNILVKYKRKNEITEEIEIREMNISLVVVPKTNASFKTGEKVLLNYFKSNSAEQLKKHQNNPLFGMMVSFVINKQGKAEDVGFEQSSDDEESNTLILDLIKNMPPWNPAMDSKGEKVKQRFLLIVGKPGC